MHELKLVFYIKEKGIMAINYIFVTLILFFNLFTVLYSQNNNLNYLGISKVGIEKSYNANVCDCGLNSMKCSYDEFNNKICICKTDYSQKGGQCEECDCGIGSQGCRFDEFGKQICKCMYTHSQNGDKCERCICGTKGEVCKFENNKIICSCFDKYLQVGDRCEKCDCGIHAIGCEFNIREKVCKCQSGYIQYSGECVECNCGAYAKDCKIVDYQKVCSCQSGYIHKYGDCLKCDCGLEATSCDLTFDKHTECTCKPGYVAEKTDGGMDEKCVLPGTPGWLIAIYVISAVFGVILLISIGIIVYKKMS